MTLRDCFEKNGIERYLTNEKENTLDILCRDLLEYNENVNLTALSTLSDVYAKHIADSAMLLPYTEGKKTLLDVGCGGGFPSLPVAILSGIYVTSLDSTKKKLDFIDIEKEKLRLKNIKTLYGRAEELCKGELRQSFDAVTARAVASLPILCELCIPYIKIGGIFAAMKTDKSELTAGEQAAKKLGAVLVKAVDYKLICKDEEAGRCIMIFKKTKDTDKKYPRRYSQIKAKPL
ncbi:MAG: 16S rRNA (guanine(527)-N(7))-methyltransferase RsmG [Clostridia bacterium]|nr:16S rRNA (guanine(527)-N(7))-methyltransferase RsmG [Clostridia bacterium]